MDKVLLQKLAKRVKELRTQRGWTQDDLSFESGVSRSTLGNIETAKNDVVLTKINMLAKAFQISLSEFFKF